MEKKKEIKKQHPPVLLSHSIYISCTFKTAYKEYSFLLHPSPITTLGYALDLLVTVSSMCYHTSTSALSTSSSSRGLTNLTLWDISS